MIDFAAIGHVVIDTIKKHDGEWTSCWGPVACISLVAKKLGKTVKTITKAGDDISDENINQLLEMGVNLDGMIVKGAKTTRVINDLRGEERQGQLVNFCEIIKPADIVGLPDSVLIDPVIWEIPWETLTAINGKTIAVDAQGFVREQRRDNDGTNLLRKWTDHGLLKKIEIFKSTEDEIRGFTGDHDTYRSLSRIVSAGTKIAVATQSGRGALLVMGDHGYRIPVFEICKMDDMGAGDAFISGFFCEYLDGKEPLWCAAVGAAMSASILETLGPRIDASNRTIIERAENIFNRIEKMPT